MKSALPVVKTPADRWTQDGHPSFLDHLSCSAAVLVRGLVSEPDCRRLSTSVYRARRRWISDFGAEQFSLGRAFYTHYETDRSSLYFRDAAASDALVERHLPGLQTFTRTLLAHLVGGTVRPRHGFCGPGVHIFPAGGKVARSGGVIHFDVEGLTPHQLARSQRAVTLVLMLQPPAWGGGLRLWDTLYQGSEHPTPAQLAAPSCTLRYRPGDALFSDSLRLHQIRPFRGPLDRISLTAHAVEVDRNIWECWF
jgi:hypothetical protein